MPLRHGRLRAQTLLIGTDRASACPGAPGVPRGTSTPVPFFIPLISSELSPGRVLRVLIFAPFRKLFINIANKNYKLNAFYLNERHLNTRKSESFFVEHWIFFPAEFFFIVIFFPSETFALGNQFLS
jgi:hypothetical protein